MLDFEIAGIGNGPSDLAIWMVMRTNATWRRKQEDEILKIYYETLIETATKHENATLTRDSYTFEQCIHDYAYRGFARNIFYVILLGYGTGQHTSEHLFGNMKDLAEQYGITAENVPPFII